MRHVLDIDDLSASDLADVLAWATDPAPPALLAGRGVGLIFEKPSNRTRNATELAVVALGGHPVTMHGDEIGLGVRESVADVTRVLGRFHAVVAARVHDHAVLETMRRLEAVPVFNLLSDLAHPSQAVADLLTLQAHWGGLAGRRLAWVGDGNNVARSLLLACARVGVHVALATPAGHAVDPVAVDEARGHGIDVSVGTVPAEAVDGADAVCTDTWVSMGQEAEREARLDAFAGYQVNDALLARAKPGAGFLHCLPAHRGEEVSPSVIDGPASWVWDEAGNRLPAARGLLRWLLEGAK